MNGIFIRRHLHGITMIALAVGVVGCAATRMKRTWTSPESQGPVGKVAVLALIKRHGFREGFENRLAQELQRAGAQAQTTFDVLSLDEIQQDKRAAADNLMARGAQSLLIMRLTDQSSRYRESRLGEERWAPVLTGMHTMGWHDYYNIGFMDLTTSHSSLTDLVYLETGLFDLKSGAQIWSGLTETYVHEETDRLSEVERIIRKVVSVMRRDGVVP
jgi:hypothetical protein